MASNKCEGNTETIPKSGSPLVKAFDKKAKGYLKALQRSLSSSSLERNFSLDEEDSTIMTIDFLRSRLQSQRAHYRAEKHRAEMLARKVRELEQKLKIELNIRKSAEHVEFGIPNNTSEFTRIDQSYSLGDPTRSLDGSFEGIVEHDVNDEKYCKIVDCQSCNNHYTLSRSPMNEKKKQIHPNFSSYACQQSSHLDNDGDFGSSYSPRQGQQFGGVNHHTFHDMETIRAQHDRNVQQEFKKGADFWGQHQEPFSISHKRELPHDKDSKSYSQCPSYTKKLSIIPGDVSPSTFNTSRAYPIYMSINTEYAKDLVPETCYNNANDITPHPNHFFKLQTSDKGSTLLQRRKMGKPNAQMSCSHCGTLLPPLVTKVDSATFLHPQQKTTLNRCISYDTLPLNSREFLKTFEVTKQSNEYYDKGLTIPPHSGKHATLAKHKQEVASIPTGF